MGAFEHDRLDEPEARVAHTIADMLHPQLYPSREGRIEISNEELGHLVGASRQSDQSGFAGAGEIRADQDGIPDDHGARYRRPARLRQQAPGKFPSARRREKWPALSGRPFDLGQMSLPARSRNEAPDLRPAFIVLVGPYHGQPELVWHSYQSVGRDLDPLAVKPPRYFPSFVSQSTSSTLWPSATEQQGPLRLARLSNH